jgi:aspartate dehydrogenase
MGAAALSGDCSAVITQAKPVASWRGTPAAEIVDLDKVTRSTCFFEGTAREAASRFPKSSNITAMLALCTAGLDHTRVKLIADPASSQMHTLIDFVSGVGKLRVEWEGVPSEINPKTSADVPLTVIKAIRNLTNTVCYGP